MRWRTCVSLGLSAFCILASRASEVEVARAAVPPRLLIITHSASFQHDVVRRDRPDRPSIVEQAIADLAKESAAFEASYVYTADEVRRLTPASVQTFDAFLLFTTGDLPMVSEARVALLASVCAGRGLIGSTVPRIRGMAKPPTGMSECVLRWAPVARASSHQGHENPTHPSTQRLEPAFEITDEIYQFRGCT